MRFFLCKNIPKIAGLANPCMLKNHSHLFQLELYDIGVKLSNDKRAVAAVVAQ